jgi:hypothetical protein
MADRIWEYIMAKYGIEKLSVNIADSILDFVNSAFANEVDNLDLADKAQESVDYAVEQAIENLDFAKLLNESLDTDSSFQDWIETRFQNQIQPTLDSIQEDLEQVRVDALALIESLETRLMALESIQNVRKGLTWTNTLARLWSDFRALFVTAKP